MDQQRKFLREIMAERGLRESTLSERIGLNPAYLNQYFRQNKPKVLPEKVREDLARELGLHPDSFKLGRRIEKPRVGPVRLAKNVKTLGRVLASGATLVDGRTTVLELQLTGELPVVVIEVDREAVDHLRENLDALDAHLRASD
jgi:transcriptional regulator with XRE-family HTH domain